MATGEQQLYIIGFYLAPDDASMIERVFEALIELPKGYKLAVKGDFNADLAQPEGARTEEEIAATLAAAGLNYMPVHFLSQRRPWCWDGRTWSMVRLGRELQ